MRKRPLIVLSTVATATLLLAGCAGGSSPDATGGATPSPSSSCVLDAQPGATSDAVVVDGEGAGATVTVPADAAFAGVERTVVSEGEGDDLAVGDLVSVRYQIVDATSGDTLDSSARGEDSRLPVLLDTSQSSLFVAALECKPVGTQVVLALPGSALGEGANNMVVYAEAVERLPEVATGSPVAPQPGLPTVELADDGAPTITVPQGAEPPAETEIAVLKQGDGATVGAGDLVVVQYRGVKWSDGTEFDSSWSRGTPTQFQTSGVVTGFRLALEGQRVGSQILAVIPPKDGYGAVQGHELANETLVFVVDILATTSVQP